MTLAGTSDAQVWAREFMEVVEAGATVDLGLMIGWFANAIETARTEAATGDEPRPPYVAAVVASEALSRLRRVDSTVHNLIDAVTSIEKTLRAYPKAER